MVVVVDWIVGGEDNTTQLAADSGKKSRGMNSIFNKIHWGRITSEVETRQATDSGDPTYIVIGISLNSSSSTSSSSSSINKQSNNNQKEWHPNGAKATYHMIAGRPLDFCCPSPILS